MKHDDVTKPPMLGSTEECAADDLESVAPERSWPLLAWEGEWAKWGPSLKPRGARAVNLKCLARTRSWNRRSVRSWVRRQSRPNVT